MPFVVLFACGPTPDDPVSFDVVAVLDVGLNPHQIAFSEDGDLAYVVAAGSNRVTIVDTRA